MVMAYFKVLPQNLPGSTEGQDRAKTFASHLSALKRLGPSFQRQQSPTPLHPKYL